MDIVIVLIIVLVIVIVIGIFMVIVIAIAIVIVIIVVILIVVVSHCHSVVVKVVSLPLSCNNCSYNQSDFWILLDFRIMFIFAGLVCLQQDWLID